VTMTNSTMEVPRRMLSTDSRKFGGRETDAELHRANSHHIFIGAMSRKRHS